ncbi:MAG: ABC transporter substrate-binding protein [Pseudomonadota bacterium]
MMRTPTKTGPLPTRRQMVAGTSALGLAVVSTAFTATPAAADQAAEDYMAAILIDANAAFNAPTEAERFSGVEALVDEYVDFPKVSRFVLGQYARVITDEQKAAFQPLFRKYATQVYWNTLSEYAGQRLAVTGSIDRSARDIIVNSKIVGANPGDQFADLVVHWRIYRSKSGQMSVVDAGAAGIWLAIEQQSQFKSVIANNGGGTRGIDALIADLSRKVGG